MTLPANPSASPSEENRATESVDSPENSTAIASDEEFWKVVGDLESSLNGRGVHERHFSRIISYLQRDQAVFANYKERRDYMRGVLYDKIKAIMGSPWEIKIYRGSRANKNGQLKASFRYKSYPHISSLWVYMKLQTIREELDDVELTIKFRILDKHMAG